MAGRCLRFECIFAVSHRGRNRGANRLPEVLAGNPARVVLEIGVYRPATPRFNRRTGPIITTRLALSQRTASGYFDLIGRVLIALGGRFIRFLGFVAQRLF